MLVSVIIPTYNRALTIRETVESALSQTYGDMEVIVVDDGSKDETAEVMRKFDGKVVFISQENAGPSAARNRGVAESKGEIVAFLDSDDHWLPEKISRQVALMERGGNSMACCVCNASVMSAEGSEAGTSFGSANLKPDFEEGEWTNPQEILATRFLLFNQVVAVRRAAFERVGGFNNNLRLLEDYELALKLSTEGTWGVIRDPLVVKYNDTEGIGVVCMRDRKHHVKVCSEVLQGILSSGIPLGDMARSELERGVRALTFESKAVALASDGGNVAKSVAKLLEFGIKASGALRRRSPRWPVFEGRAL